METAVIAVGVRYEMIDLSARLSLAADLSGPHARTVLYSYGNGRCALRVEEVLGLIDVHRADQRPLPPQFRGAERVWFAGLVLYQDTFALVLNPSWLLGTGAMPAKASPGSTTAESGVLQC